MSMIHVFYNVVIHFIYYINNNHESRFDLFELFNQQCTTYKLCPVAGFELMTAGSVAKRLTLSRHTSI